jgi:hypothetical protein
MKIRIGIDPGKSGYITIWKENEGFSFLSMPIIGKEVDLHSLVKQFVKTIPSCGDIHCVLEDVHGIFGSSTKATFSFGGIAKAMEMMLICFDIPYTKVQPKAWQKQMWQGVANQKKPSSTGKTMVNDTKSMSEVAARRLFPTVDLRDTPRCKKAHDGKVDSLLICEYCKRNF